MEGDGQREPRSSGGGDAGPGEGRDDADVGVNDVGAQAGQEVVKLTAGSRMNGQLTGQMRGGAVDREAVSPFDAAARPSPTGVAVTTAGSWPASFRLRARSRT